MNVKKIQCLLYACDIDPGPIDGVLGEKTKTALDKLYAEYGVDENGLIDVLSGKIQRVKDDDFWKTVRHFKKKEFACPCGECNGFPVEINVNYDLITGRSWLLLLMIFEKNVVIRLLYLLELDVKNTILQ